MHLRCRTQKKSPNLWSGCAELDRVPLGPEPSGLPMTYTPNSIILPTSLLKYNIQHPVLDIVM